VLSAAAVERQGFFRPDAVTRLIDDHVAGTADNSRKIWALLTFSLWFDRYASGDVPPEQESAPTAALVSEG
jgi:hypothetical protein